MHPRSDPSRSPWDDVRRIMSRYPNDPCYDVVIPISRGSDIGTMSCRSQPHLIQTAYAAITHRHLDVFEAWITAGGDIHARNGSDLSLGHHCASVGSSVALRLWVGAGGDPCAVQRSTGHGIGHAWACSMRPDHAWLDTWLHLGGSVRAIDTSGCTIGDILARGGHDTCLRAWINRGGSLWSPDGHHPQRDAYRMAAIRMVKTMDPTSDEYGLLVTRSYLRIMGHRLLASRHEPMAFRSRIGSDLASYAMMHMPDPLHMASCIQRMDMAASSGTMPDACSSEVRT